ncbi:MAG: hypothetical protein FJ137_02100 [Deltaproteobacteria bacterium]|nr:hypothetical protein [Deltaproteobacteria bacterium]
MGAFSLATTVVLGEAGGSVRFDGFLPGQIGASYFFNADRLLTNALTSLSALQADPTPPLPAELVVRMDAVDFDPYLAVVDNAACTVLDENDDLTPGDTRASAVRVDLREVDADTHFVATSFFADATGSYALRVRPTLCGVETDSLATWNLCALPMATRDFTCANNPCARDVNNALVGKYCCLNENCGRTGDEPAFLADNTALCN